MIFLVLEKTNIALKLSNTMPMKRSSLVPKLITNNNNDTLSYLSLKDRRRPLPIDTYDRSVEPIWGSIGNLSDLPPVKACKCKLAEAK
jgi:hypothetical protein